MPSAYRKVELGSDEDLVEVALHAEFPALFFHALGRLTNSSFAADQCSRIDNLFGGWRVGALGEIGA